MTANRPLVHPVTSTRWWHTDLPAGFLLLPDDEGAQQVSVRLGRLRFCLTFDAWTERHAN